MIEISYNFIKLNRFTRSVDVKKSIKPFTKFIPRSKGNRGHIFIEYKVFRIV